MSKFMTKNDDRFAPEGLLLIYRDSDIKPDYFRNPYRVIEHVLPLIYIESLDPVFVKGVVRCWIRPRL